ncbi:NAD(P)-dependent dehydrogenase (short-subunit alcohol dehydrogenase family) [Mucilaginibacter gracilis]|uniref:NAD(P)-dependent dehydrogenase (Short-subunit alcohol dehydrogenase family) n=1 Tax=Mucilaginibacter gracilis TaxID=423350 RepID=A0A495J7S6_9SPHI|nr:oxidoreductase [Mucilaginibacter gracilis]RKR84652.1 NAD(P)-dependent dehydrogenase (short-subunit alcohol dehydrogenase family) [Mucilaginibacter gracilis]
MKDYANEFQGKKALVTGGSRGIGAATAQRLIDGGATVAVAARSRHEQTPAGASFIQGDITTLAGANDVTEDALKILGGLDILVNNAGAATPRLPGIEMITDEDWMDSLMINFMSAVRITNPLLNALRQSGSGAIVNVSSGGVIPFHGFLAHYGAAKAALSSYTKSLAKELGPAGIRVNIVTPGAILTPGGNEGREQLAAAFGITVEQLFKAIPLEGKPGTAADMAEMIAFLVSDRAAYITGHNHFVSGGQGELA